MSACFLVRVPVSVLHSLLATQTSSKRNAFFQLLLLLFVAAAVAVAVAVVVQCGKLKTRVSILGCHKS